MAIECIDESNFAGFLESERAVLVFSLPGCPACEEYELVYDALSDSSLRGDVRFGKVVLDDNSPQLILRDLGLVVLAGLPATAVLRDGAICTYFSGAYGYEDTFEMVSSILDSFEIRPDNYVARLRSFNFRTRQDIGDSLDYELRSFLEQPDFLLETLRVAVSSYRDFFDSMELLERD